MPNKELSTVSRYLIQFLICLYYKVYKASQILLSLAQMFKQDQQDCHNPVCRQNPLGRLRSNLYDAKQNNQCPIDKQQLGQYTWSLLHTFAAYYPQKPSDAQKNIMKGWLQGFKFMYPCSYCQKHFERDYERDPPNLQSQKQLSIWVCRQHNYVNKMIGKPQYSCEYQGLMKRWKNGCDFQSF